ncbi:MAG: DegT/DnrJ/EryC1/StrS family aminotransferase [Planctomycetes bacterium]|nr:DegT/DnrJ/EryC1/StrS family aminotransferase [Planctomycetota bacterium]
MQEAPEVPFYRHSLTEEDIAEVATVLRSLFLTTGPVTARLEEKLAAYLGVKHVVAVSSCTSALFLSLKALGIGPGDEVITTPMTFIATSNAVLHAGARPVFVDVEPATGNLDVARVAGAITPRTRAVIPVHLYGQMVDMVPLARLCRERGIAIVEDAAHALEARQGDVRPARLGDAACFSFYATKNLTCGEGGAVATSSDELKESLRRLRMHGMSRGAADRSTGRHQHWDMERLGFKANLSDIQSALLVHQIDRIEEQLARREAIARRYEEAFRGIGGLDFPRVKAGNTSARHLFTIWVPPERRDHTIAELERRQIGVAVNYRAVHLLSYYREAFGHEPGSFPIAEAIGSRTITIPLYPGLTDGEVDRVIAAVREVAGSW